MNIPDEAKAKALVEAFGAAFRMRGEDGKAQPDADDLLAFFAAGIAAILENDSNLDTPRLRRLAIETAGEHIKHGMRYFSEYRAATGQSFMATILGEPVKSDGLKH